MCLPHKWRFTILFLFAFTLTTHSNAFTFDTKAPIRVKADEYHYNFKTGRNEFVGNVNIDQGNTHITADRVVTEQSQQLLKIATAYGNKTLAHLWTTPADTKEAIDAKAKIIKFYPVDDSITLEQTVLLKQNNNTFHGEHIHYNHADQTITVPSTHSGRAEIVYHPEK